MPKTIKVKGIKLNPKSNSNTNQKKPDEKIVFEFIIFAYNYLNGHWPLQLQDKPRFSGLLSRNKEYNE